MGKSDEKPPAGRGVVDGVLYRTAAALHFCGESSHNNTNMYYCVMLNNILLYFAYSPLIIIIIVFFFYGRYNILFSRDNRLPVYIIILYTPSQQSSPLATIIFHTFMPIIYIIIIFIESANRTTCHTCLPHTHFIFYYLYVHHNYYYYL